MKPELALRLSKRIVNTFTPNERTVCDDDRQRTVNLSRSFLPLLLLFLFSFSKTAFSQTNTWNGGGANNWTIAGDWSLGHVPLAAEDVIIRNNKDVTINTAAICRSFTIEAGNNNNNVTISGSNSLTVGNGILIHAGTGITDDKIIAVGAGTLTASSITIDDTGNDLWDSQLTLSTGTVNITGNIIMNGSSARNSFTFTGAGLLNVGGDITGGILVPATGTVNYNGGNPQTISGAGTSSFYNLVINKSSAANTVTSVANAFSVGNNLTVTQGNLLLQATNANYVVSNDFSVSLNGTITHSVDWNLTGKLFSIGGNAIINGLFNYTVRSHVQMSGSGAENVCTGSNPSSAFSILTLLNGNFSASNTLRVNDNFWAMFNSSGSFHTNSQTVYANGVLLNAGGTVYVDGGTLNVSGGFFNGYGTNGTVNFSAGTLNTDALTLGTGSTGTFIHSAGTANINGNLLMTAGSYTCSGAPVINMTGNWINNINAGAFTAANSTVSFNSTTADQSIMGTTGSQAFRNISINKAGWQLNVGGSTTALTLSGALNLSAGSFTAGTAATINIAGNWANSGTAFNAGAGTVVFNGSAAQAISGSTLTAFNNLTLNNTAGISLSGTDAAINGGAACLTLTNGKITTGANKIRLGSMGTIAGANASRYVYGNLQMAVATGSPAKTFEIGDGSTYAPISAIFNSVSAGGNVTAYTIGGEHPSVLNSTIDETKSVNRYWNLSNSGVSLTSITPTFTFPSGDVDAGANTSNFIIGKYSGSWLYATGLVRTTNTTSGTIASFGDYAIGEGAAAKPLLTTQPGDLSLCTGSTATFTTGGTIVPIPTAVWEISTNGGSTFNTLSIVAPYSVSTTTVSGVTNSVLTITPVAGALDNNLYRAIFSNSRGKDTSYEAYLHTLISPTVSAGPALSPICGVGTSAALGGSIGGSATSAIWTSSAGGTFTPNANSLNATWSPTVGFSGTATLTLTTAGGSCGSVNASKTQVVSASANAISITPSGGTICNGAVQMLTAGNINTVTVASGTINLAIPDFSAAGISNTIALAGIPAGATVTGVSVTMNVNHPKVNDLVINLRAPNGNILNLANRPGTTGANFLNTIVSSAGTTAFSAGTVPYTATFKADAVNSVGATGQVSNVTAFSSLFSTANGNWVLSSRDAALTNSGTIASWSITVTYTDPISWLPIAGLYTDAGATTAYVAGQNYPVIYAKPLVSGANTYTATATTSNGCTATQNVTVTTGPAIVIATDYCYGGGMIRLTCNSTPASTSWLWNTGATTQSILVDLAGNYQVTATTSGGCVGSAIAPIAQELVVNGDFSAGNMGFTSSYGFVSPTISNGMYPEGKYTVNEDPTFNHNLFWGRDHTSNTGKLMIVNGSGSTVTIWQETMAVQPNTTYYFSAWAISLNPYAPYAQLQFDVNGTLIGTTAVLAAGPSNNNPPYNWVRFYGSWTSGASITSATVGIKDLQTALGGNDFGLDDISFGTLSTFITHTSAAGTDSQTVCKNTPIINNIYSIGSGAGGPTVTGLPPGVTSSFNGVSLTISGTPTTLGTYNFTISTTGTCSPILSYGRIIVTEQTIARTSAAGTDAQTICQYSAITPITYSVGGSATGAGATGLPPGITGTYSSGVFTLSGSPLLNGAYSYKITTTGNCDSVIATGTITVNRNIILRTSPAGTNAQHICVNTPITNIVYALSGSATGAFFTGLPAGITGSVSGSVVTISGTPTIQGVYTYSITATGSCSTNSTGGTITVNGQTIYLSSAAGTNAQVLCYTNAITDISYTIGGTATGAGVTGLPAGVSGSYSAGVFTISGTPTVTGIFNYTITTTGTCPPAAIATGTINVAQQTISLTSAASTTTQTTCINAAITNITYATVGSTGAGITGLPSGVIGSFSAGLFTISGTPTVAGTFNYTVTTTGTCSPAATATGTITVTQQTILLTSAAATTTQAGCINAAITNITYATGGTATGAGVTGLPTGVTGSYSGGVFTISGTPTVAGVFNYTVTTTGTCSPAATATGIITVTQQTILLTSPAATTTQTGCINAAITNITYSTGGTATGAGVTGLPTGVTGSYSAGVFTISGTPTVAGTFNYIVTTTGTCSPAATATGTITVTQQTIALTSAAATTTQTGCINAAITNITYATGGTATGAGVTGLPTGVAGSYSAGVFTISGIPTVAGVFNYTVTTTGTCSPAATATGTITVTQQTIVLTSAPGTNIQTGCINAAITNITYSTGGTATGAGVTGLPTGVTGSYSAGVFTISGTPTVAGTFNYTVTTTGTCSPAATANGTITVTQQTIALTSAAGTTIQTGCINAAITNITYAAGGTATGAGVTGLPTGVAGSFSSGVLTISGTPTIAGVFNYTVTTTGTCSPAATATGTITVTQQTIALTSAAATTTQTGCINAAITNITYATGGTATGAGVTGLPTGVTGSYSGGVFTISGTPTVAGVFNYTVTTTGTCSPAATATGIITVTQQTILLTSPAATTTQTGCINAAITNITYSTGGTATGAGVTGLPTGVAGSFNSGVLTISGTPTVAGTFNYTVTTTGTCSPAATANGTITVTQQTIALTSAAGTTTQTGCINAAITNITYAAGGTATGAGVTGLPTGVAGSFSSGVLTISGTPTVAGVFNYTVTTTGTCSPAATATGSITINQQSISLTSAAGTNSQTKCINSAITSITYGISGTATGAGVTGLPTGVTGSYSGGVLTISGTPTVAGVFNYTVTTTGTCSPAATATGTITVTQQTIALTSAAATTIQTGCINAAIINITYATGGTATGAGVTGLPTGVMGSYSGGVFTISGTPTVAGTFNYTVTTTGTCSPAATATGTITVTQQTIALTSAAATTIQTGCINAAITNITYATGGTATGAGVTGLPTGVTGSYSAGVFTISGTPTVAGTYNYIVTTTGTCSPAATATGTITVTQQTIALTSAAATTTQTGCINAAITNITYATGGTATGAGVTGLPIGVTGFYSAGVFTISGTPTVAGTFNYTVTTTGACSPAATATGTITVMQQIILLTSAAATTTQTGCINAAITNITYTTGGTATGAGVTGLPTGVTGSYSGGVFTISGTPTVPGTFNYTVTTTGTCLPAAIATGTITVTQQTIALTSAAATTTQTGCINAAITNITYATGGTATGAGVTGLPTGVAGSFTAGVFTISGTPTVAGVFNYTVTTTGTCSPAATANGTLIVTQQSIGLTSAAATTTQTGCINAAITNITYATGGTATGAGVTGLPTGVTGLFSAGVFTISGTPTVAGTFNYAVTTTGTCSPAATANGTLIVTQQSIGLTSAAATTTQTGCINAAITNITYATGGTATGASVTGLPTGVAGSYSGGVFTISGTPTVAGTFNYTVTTTGTCSPAATATGTITVTQQTIALTSAAATTTQTGCINAAITNITYASGGTATGAGVTGLPTGVTGSYSAGVFTISGTPTVAGTFNYTVTTTGTCSPAATATGTITVTQQTIVLTSAAATTTQTGCINAAITNITYATGGTATGAGVTGLPTGVAGSYSAGVFTISGAPTVAGTFNYTITTTGTCLPAATATGTITVTQQTILLTSAPGTNTQTGCINAAITNITYATGGTATSAGVTGLPTGVTGAFSAGVFTISGTPTVAGTFNYTVTTTGTCSPAATATGTITVTQQTIALTSAAATTTQTGCINAAITNITYSTGGTATGAGVTGLPTGVAGSYSAGVFTISGAPTVAGTFNYTITTTGTCSPAATATGTITVTQQTILLTSGPGTNTQTGCINAAITNITYATGGTATSAGVTGLPTGVTGAFSAGVFTISGTPTVAGTFNYTVTTTGTCSPPATATGAIAITQQTISLTSAAATNSQTKCINSAITPVTYSITGTATGAGVTGLPAGVTGAYSAGILTISGTPTVAGTFNYTVTTTGTCSPAATATGTLIITQQTITLTSAGGTINQTKCINTAITNIKYSTGGTATGATVAGLPTGVNGAYSGTVFTISGTPTVAGVFNYTVTTTGTCSPAASATGTITVTQQTIVLASAAGTNAQTRCISTAITNIKYTVGGTATGATVTGLPAGVSGSYGGGVFLITGTPTVAGVFNYTVTTTGTCAPAATATGTITVTQQTIALTSAAGTTAQTLCVNSALTDISYGVGGTASGAGVTGLPAGVTGSFSAGVFTISGTPTVAGTFNYTITTTGTCSPAATASGTITVSQQTILLTSAVATITQTGCINSAITNITYSTGGTATGAGVTGLPTGVTGSYSAGVFTISGTPSLAGTFNYTVTTTGTCSPAATATGTITVNQQSISLTSAAATTTQSSCINAAITSITYSISGSATDAGVAGLPTGITGTYSGGIFTISGTPTIAGVFPYTITTTGTCSPVATAGGILTVTEETISLTSAASTVAQSTCINNIITGITYAVGGSASGAVATGLPPGTTGSYTGGTFTISGAPTAGGIFNYTVTTTGACAPAATASGTITVIPATIGGTVASVSVCSGASGTLTLTGNVGSVIRWETSTDAISWSNISNSTSIQAFTTPTRTVYFRALVQNGGCGTPVYSTTGKVGIHNLWTGITSSDWNTGSNWSDDMTPTTSCPDVTIPVLTFPNVYPQLTSGTAAVNNLIIYPAATMVISNATLQVAGVISNAGTLIATNGTVELNGSASTQTIAGSVFDNHSIKNLIISNSNGVNFSGTNDTVKITGLLSFGASNAILNTNNNLTLISNAAGTASVGDLTNGGLNSGNDIVGNATVERYIPLHPKAWQFLSIPTTGQSIKNAWQEGNSPLANTTHPGYGSIITSPVSGAVALGFDIYTPTGPSMKTYNSLTNGWDGVASPSQQIANQKGYMFFVRGDRSVTTSSAPATVTTLRTTGRLYTTGVNAPPAITVLPGRMESVGNPYASAVDFRLLTRPIAPAIDDVFYVWDPLLTNNYYGLGGYQTMSAANGWKPIPGGTTNYDAGLAYPDIQSGQAFIVHATGAGGPVSFTESAKVSQYALSNRTSARMADRQFFRTSLYNTYNMLSDGNVVAFDSAFSKMYDADDALKLPNTSENIGIKKDDRNLALEARSLVVAEDTVYYTLGNLRVQSYRLKFNPENITPGLSARLLDKFLNTSTNVLLTDTSSYGFNVSASAGSYATDRFCVIFHQTPVPAIVSVSAIRNTNSAGIVINWSVAHEYGIGHYEIQRSSTGSNFQNISTGDPSGNAGATATYNFMDQSPLTGINYYRVKAMLNNGDLLTSDTVKVLPGKILFAGKNSPSNLSKRVMYNSTPADNAVSIFPNPVVNKMMNITFNEQASGSYNLELISNTDQVLFANVALITEKIQELSVHLPREIAAGAYRLKITGPDHFISVKLLIIK